MAIVCFDTHMLIWGIKEEANSSQQAMIERAKAIIQQCEAQDDTVVVPALVVGEVLCNRLVPNQQELWQALNDSFIVAPYDARAAIYNAQIWQEQLTVRQALRTQETPRQAIKTDITILSTALAYNCEILYTEDKDLAQLAERYITVRKISDVQIPPEQPGLFPT